MNAQIHKYAKLLTCQKLNKVKLNFLFGF